MLPLSDELNYGQLAIKDAVIIEYLAAAFLFHCVSLFSHLHKEKKCLRVTPWGQKGSNLASCTFQLFQ